MVLTLIWNESTGISGESVMDQRFLDHITLAGDCLLFDLI